MPIQPGDRIPAATLATMAENKPVDITTDEIFSGRKVLLFAVPGAFTPTCSARHLPGFIDLAPQFHERGIDSIACMAVNDVFVMDAWGKSAGAGEILMFADGNADFTKAMGLEMDARAFGMGVRSQRFDLLAEDGVVRHLFLEGPGEFRVSSAEHVLANLD